MDPEELKKHIDDILFDQNNRAIPEFEGYSHFEMHQLLYNTFGTDSPVSLRKLSDPYYQQIPLLNQIKYLMQRIDEAGEII